MVEIGNGIGPKMEFSKLAEMFNGTKAVVDCEDIPPQTRVGIEFIMIKQLIEDELWRSLSKYDKMLLLYFFDREENVFGLPKDRLLEVQKTIPKLRKDVEAFYRKLAAEVEPYSRMYMELLIGSHDKQTVLDAMEGEFEAIMKHK